MFQQKVVIGADTKEVALGLLPADQFGRLSLIAGPLALSIVVPCLNEVGNVAELFRRIDAILPDAGWEIVFVDDGSIDGTWQKLTGMAQADRRIRLIRRIGRRGLSSAVLEGAFSTTAPVIAIIDADLQHDETRLPLLFAAIADGADLAVGSRYCDGGSIDNWDQKRVGISRLATRLAKPLLKQAPVSDPMSGFFAIRREALLKAAPRVSTIGFKILLDLIASSPQPLKVTEVAYHFRDRLSGTSKLDSAVALQYGELLLDKLIGPWVPVKLVMFGAIGALGVLIHLGVLGSLLALGGVRFAAAQFTAVLTAMTFNFFLNNALTYHDRQLKGAGLIKGLGTFYAVCSLGAIGNVGVGSLVYQNVHAWWAAGVAGAIVGSVWNYAASSWLTWTRR